MKIISLVVFPIALPPVFPFRPEPALSLSSPQKAAAHGAPEMPPQEGIIYFKGETSMGSYHRLVEPLGQSSVAQLHGIIVHSEGGDTIAGRKIGELIFERGLNVEAETICFSACANYIFPAGKQKRVQSGAMVGRHGNEYQGRLLKANRQTLEEYRRQELEQAFLGTSMKTREHPELFERELSRILSKAQRRRTPTIHPVPNPTHRAYLSPSTTKTGVPSHQCPHYRLPPSDQ